MLKGNLANRPFYNQRMISIVVGVIAIVALGLAAFNGWELYTLSRSRADLRGSSKMTRWRFSVTKLALIWSIRRSLALGGKKPARSSICGRSLDDLFGLIEKACRSTPD
jgi:hypothetical protein